jgi:RNA polymerase sigma factor (sigma-70 family)
MSDMEKDFSVEIKVRNGRLLTAIREKFGTIAEMCRQTDVNIQAVYHLLSMKRGPLKRNGQPTRAAETLMMVLGKKFEQLWPNDLAYNTMEKNTAEVFMDIDEVQALTQKSPHEMLEFRNTISVLMNSLNERQKDIIQRRMSGEKLKEIADDYDLTPQSIRVIEFKAVRKMRARAAYLGIREMF